MTTALRPSLLEPAKAGLRVGLVGAGIKRSLSPHLHEAEGAALGLCYRYQLVDLDDEVGGVAALPAVLDRMQAAGYAGTNITHPVKQAVMPLLDSLSSDATALGAVNTVRFGADGTRKGHNTDWWGFGENLRRTLGSAPTGRVVVLGAGGAGSAAAYALGRMDVELVVIDTALARAEAVAERMRAAGFAAAASPHADLGGQLARANGLVQATPIGMVGHPGLPIKAEDLRPGLWVAEIVYVPLETELLRAARAAGCRTADGGGMVVLQAARAIEIFSGHPADAARMSAHFAALVA